MLLKTDIVQFSRTNAIEMIGSYVERVQKSDVLVRMCNERNRIENHSPNTHTQKMLIQK